MNARFVKHPVTGIENNALYIPCLGIFDVLELWYHQKEVSNYNKFLAMLPNDMAKIVKNNYKTTVFKSLI